MFRQNLSRFHSVKPSRIFQSTFRRNHDTKPSGGNVFGLGFGAAGVLATSYLTMGFLGNEDDTSPEETRNFRDLKIVASTIISIVVTTVVCMH